MHLIHEVQESNDTAREILSSILEVYDSNMVYTGRYSCVLSWQWSNVNLTEERHLEITGEFKHFLLINKVSLSLTLAEKRLLSII